MINWVPFSPKALDFLAHSDASLNILDGSVRSGKTVVQTVRWIEFLVIAPPGDMMMLGKSMATLKRNVLNDLFDILGPQQAQWVDRQQGELRLCGRRVYALGASNEEAEGRIRGATLVGAYCDEVSLYPESVWMQLQARLSVPGAKCFANCNPDSPYHWFFTNVINNNTIVSKKRWTFKMDDNYSLSEEYKIQLASMFSGVFKRRFIDGEWCVAEGLVYDNFVRANVIKYYDADYLSKYAVRWFIGCDHGTSTVTSWSLLVELKDRPGHMHKVAEYYYDAVLNRKQKSDDEFFADFVRFLDPWRPLANRTGGFYMAYVDPAASSWDAMLTQHHVLHLHGDNDVIAGIRYVSTLFSMGLYTIDPSCKNTIGEYETYSWDSNAQIKGEDKPVKKHDHAVDSDRYGLYTYGKNKLTGVYKMRRN